jgi:hypothetical protein
LAIVIWWHVVGLSGCSITHCRLCELSGITAALVISDEECNTSDALQASYSLSSMTVNTLNRLLQVRGGATGVTAPVVNVRLTPLCAFIYPALVTLVICSFARFGRTYVGKRMAVRCGCDMWLTSESPEQPSRCHSGSVRLSHGSTWPFTVCHMLHARPTTAHPRLMRCA